MARLSRAQHEARRCILDLCGQALAPNTLGQHIASALGDAIPCDGFRLLGIDPSTRLVNRVIAASHNDGWARDEWLREVYLRSESLPYIEIPELMRLGLSAVAMHEHQADCWGLPNIVMELVAPNEHHEAFHALRSPVGGTLFGCFASHGQWIAALQMYRRDPERPFKRTDVAFLQLLAPAIGNALAAAFRREIALETGSAGAPAASGVIMLDRHGRTTFATPAGEAWCDILKDGSDTLPSALLAAAAQARTNDTGAGNVYVPTSFGTIRVEVSRADQSGSLAVVITPQRQRSDLALPASWDLTSAEQRVVELAVRGLENQQIAERLHISPSTVQTHLRHAYEKLNVRGRTQLLARLFDHHFTTITGE